MKAFIAAMFVLAACHPGQARTAPVPAAYWTMDEIIAGALRDQAGLHHARIPELTGMKDAKFGGVLPDFVPSTEPGVKGKALALVRSQQGFLNIAAPKELYFANGMTVSAWVKIKSASAQMIVFSCAEDLPNPKGGWCLTYSYGSVFLKAVDSTGKAVRVTSPHNSVPAGAWVHIAAVADAKALRIYCGALFCWHG